MAEATNGISTTLAPKSVKQPGWRPGTHDFIQVVNNRLVHFDADRRVFDSGVTLDYLNKGKLPKEKSITFPLITWGGRYLYYFQKDSFIHLAKLSPKAGEGWDFVTLKNAAANITYQATSNVFAFTVDNNLWINKGGSNIAVTGDTNRNIINGQAVHRNEFGIDKGIFFSPKGNYLAYYRMDQTMVEDYPVIDWSVTPAKVENVKYPMAGRTSHRVTVQVYNIATKQTISLNTILPFRAGEHVTNTDRDKDFDALLKLKFPQDQYLTCVTWSPDEKYIYIAILNRAQNHLWLNQYNAQTGEKVKTILQERDDKYVEPQHPLSFLPGSNTQFIWWSQRDGYMHLWLCDMATNKMRCLTPGDYVVNDLIGFNPRTKEVLLTSAKEDPREKHGYAVNWETEKMRRLDTEPGTHNYTASDDGEYLFDVFNGYPPQMLINNTSMTMFRQNALPAYDEEMLRHFSSKKSVIRLKNGDIVATLLDSRNPLAEYMRPQIQDVILNSKNDDPELYGKLILPTNFDEKKKYPVIVYLYNGPHVQLVKNGFPESGNLWFEYLAQHGYIVWTMDGRGSSNRGLKFEQAVFRHLGTVEMEDQLKGVQFLKSLPYVDTTRIGVHGWSFGGFMTTSLMLHHPGVFKCAVAGGPVMDWSMYEVMYGERYMDTPEENPEGYKESALFDKVKNLKGKLMLIHGTQDATVVWQHSIKFLKACVDEGVQVDYFVYPGYEHNVRGKDRVHLMQKITDYFDANL